MARWLTGKKMLPAALAVVVLAGVLVWVLVLRGPGMVQDEKYLIGAYYYQWFPHNFTRGYLREKLVPPQPPQLGRYSSRDPKAVERHIAWATRHGIDFLALDWWPGVDKVNSVISESFLKARNIGDIKFCLFYESYGAGFRAEYGSTIFSDEMTENFVADVVKMAGLFFDHPSYLRVDGRPVVFFYVTRTFYGNYAQALERIRAELGKKGIDPYLIGDEIFWKVTATKPNRAGAKGVEVKEVPAFSRHPQKERIRLFDAITSYNMYESEYPEHAGYGARSKHIPEVRAKYREYREACGGKVAFVPNVMPGYNDRGDRPNDKHYVIPRQWDQGRAEGSFLSKSFDLVGFPFADPRLNMIMITSFNEWNEDTAVEPTRTTPPTTRDDSESRDFFTQGYSYQGFGTLYLETVRDKVCSVWGRVKNAQGKPVRGAEVRAWKGDRIVGQDATDTEGYYTLSRLRMPPGEYEVGLKDGSARLKVRVEKDRAAALEDLSTD